jgi:uncharacterized membrane protein
MKDLGTLPAEPVSVATKINVFGQVIGSSYETHDDQRAQAKGRPFLWTQKTGMRYLNTLVPTTSGWAFNSATDIKPWGQIVGQGTRNGNGSLLTPRTLFGF